MNKLFYLLFSAAGVIVIGSFVMFFVESQHPDSQINSMLDAVWWTVATVHQTASSIELICESGCCDSTE